jgi:7-keto-8-aminopelargonate synthetase-like enzyme
VVFADRGNHASLVDGVRLSFATERKYRHNDLAHLEQIADFYKCKKPVLLSSSLLP